jgi:hypothetical protein
MMRVRLRHRIMPTATPGVATSDAPKTKIRTTEQTVLQHRLEKVFRAGRSETTARARATQPVQGRREEALVKSNHDRNQGFHAGEACGGGSTARRMPALLATFCQSRCMSAKEASTALQRGMTTQSQPGAISICTALTISLNCRLSLTRVTAPPSLREVIRPKRKGRTLSSLSTERTT